MEIEKNGDPTTTDPPFVDWDFPPDIVPVVINSQGANLNGIIYISQGPGPHPTVILLHGYPGNEKNLDLAQAVRRAGWNALIFHYRGFWGSEGACSHDNTLEDVSAAIDFLSLPDTQQNCRADPSRIALVGHSLGGYLALMVGSQRAAIRKIGCFAWINMAEIGKKVKSRPAEAAAFAAWLDSAGAVKGMDGEGMLSKISEDLPKYDLLERVAHLDGKSLLLVGAARDTQTPLDEHFLPLVERLRVRNKAYLTETVLDTDHVFSSARIALARIVTEWLTDN